MNWLPRNKPRWAPTEAALEWKDSTLAEMAWDRSRSAGKRFAIVGSLLGVFLGFIAFAPAKWLASSVATLSNQHLLMVEPRGLIWSGSAKLVLTGGAGSRDASALPGRAHWSVGLHRSGIELRISQECCLEDVMILQVTPGFGGMRINLVPSDTQWIGQWPSAWLTGLGTPWNTLQPQGAVKLHSSGLTLESVHGRWLVAGHAQLDFENISSRLSTLAPLGSYQLVIQGASDSSGSSLTLSTVSGAFQLNGSGLWSRNGLRFTGEATAQEQYRPVLQNLLNIIGRRDGARSVISIG